MNDTIATPAIEDVDRTRKAADEALEEVGRAVLLDLAEGEDLGAYTRKCAAAAQDARDIAARTFGEWYHHTLTDEQRDRTAENSPYFAEHGHRCVLCEA